VVKVSVNRSSAFLLTYLRPHVSRPQPRLQFTRPRTKPTRPKPKFFRSRPISKPISMLTRTQEARPRPRPEHSRPMTYKFKESRLILRTFLIKEKGKATKKWSMIKDFIDSMIHAIKLSKKL